MPSMLKRQNSKSYTEFIVLLFIYLLYILGAVITFLPITFLASSKKFKLAYVVALLSVH